MEHENAILLRLLEMLKGIGALIERTCAPMQFFSQRTTSSQTSACCSVQGLFLHHPTPNSHL